MSSTPLIKSLQVAGGTLFATSSASNDLTFTLQNDTKKFRFSHYALLDLPNIDTPSNGENSFQFDTIDGAWTDQTSNAELNLVQSFQNYFLNFETMLNNNPTYDTSIDKTVAERVFFKWLKELGAVRFRDANSTEKSSNTVNSRFVEINDDLYSNTQKYSKVVKYIGKIDMKNSVKSVINTYEEIFILVPTESGNTPTVLFKTIDDVNYSSGLSLQNRPANPLQTEYIVGRGPSDIHPSGLSLTAYFDDDGSAIPTTINGTPGQIYTYGEDNSYCTEASFNNSTIEQIIKHTASPNKTISYLRSRLDGITIDFDTLSYKDFETNPALKSLADYNNSEKSGDYKFNAVLLYYDIYDPVTLESTTNLYGVLFVNPVQLISGGASELQRLVKIKPNAVSKTGGTGYGFRVNLKISGSLDQAQTEVTFNEYSTFSMGAFIESLSKLTQASDLLEHQLNVFQQLNNKVIDLENLILTGTDVNKLQVQVNDINKALQANQATFLNSKDIVNMISNLRLDIDKFLLNQTPIKYVLDLNQLKNGFGISFDKSNDNQLTISSSANGYVVSDSIQQWPTSGLLNYKIKRGNNLIIIRSLIPSLEVSDRIIRLDDSETPWIVGQTVRLTFQFDLDMNGSTLYLYTDSKGVTNTQSIPWNNLVTQLSEEYMRTWNFDATVSHDACFDIVCLSVPTTNSPGVFHVDKIR